MAEPTVIAIDWSGAIRPAAQRDGICIAEAGPSGSTCSAGRTREQTIAVVRGLDGPCVIGFDFCFGAPAWFARELGCSTVGDLWDVARMECDTWLVPTSPFWRNAGTAPPRNQR